ncbi:hypothetical protein MARI151_60487 [Maribacter litoralis]|uniref:Uncharacterized protein n=1 Tax=Maribacter litoralis TaxID=2059726 RepID=A0A653X6E2_9FLAO|nr:hypothetical protein MARI151_60487 [Maribacter litoralis]
MQAFFYMAISVITLAEFGYRTEFRELAPSL